jgi:hypothetical protein
MIRKVTDDPYHQGAALSFVQVAGPAPFFQSHLVQMNINERSTKADIIDASCELIDSQAERIADLEERQLVLWAMVGILSVLLAMGA